MKIFTKKKIVFVLRITIVLFLILLFERETLSKNSYAFVDNLNQEKVLLAADILNTQDKLYDESLYKVIKTFTGEMTGYAGDCRGCTGILACRPRTNVLKTGIFFNDKEYGKIRIVAGSRNYKCGTIIKFESKKLSDEPIIAIVMDRGGAITGNRLDLLVENEDYARKNVGRIRKLEVEVLRNGWS